MPDRRLLFVQSLADGLSMSDACREFGISRPTGYDYKDRYDQEGVAGLLDRSRAPHHRPHVVDQSLVTQILALKARYPTWGPKKLKATLEASGGSWPAASTIGEILKRAGLVKPRRRRSRCPVAPLAASIPDANDVWCVDFKGQFKLGNNAYCFPLTLTDLASRYLLRCQALPDICGAKAWPYFVGAFQEYGLPRAIRSDNGSPFASASVTGVTKLTLQLIKLGIRLERIAPGKPQQNGAHERMHRTLKAEAIHPLSETFVDQQARFDRWQLEYNFERPHEALGQIPPGTVYAASTRPYPLVMPELEYPAGMRVTRVRQNGQIRWRGDLVYVSDVLIGEQVGLSNFDEYYHALYVGHQPVAVLDERGPAFLRPVDAAPLIARLSIAGNVNPPPASEVGA